MDNLLCGNYYHVKFKCAMTANYRAALTCECLGKFHYCRNWTYYFYNMATINACTGLGCENPNLSLDIALNDMVMCEEVPDSDLPLFMGFARKTELFEKSLTGEWICPFSS